MEEISTVGLDIAKSVFQVDAINDAAASNLVAGNADDAQILSVAWDGIGGWFG